MPPHQKQLVRASFARLAASADAVAATFYRVQDVPPSALTLHHDYIS